MPTTIGLQTAKLNKKDEFYTRYEDIEAEVAYHKKDFSGKIVFCNCDDPVYSAFWKFYHLNFSELGLKKLITTHYDPEHPTYKIEYTGGNDTEIDYGQKIMLSGNGDFRSEECLNILKECDIVSTNPPFSLFKEYLPLMMKYRKQLLILGNMNSISVKSVSRFFRDGELWYGPSIHSGDRMFYVPDDYPLDATGCGVDENGRRFIRVKGVRWFTNFDYPERHMPYHCVQPFTSQEYPKYDNFDAIDVSQSSKVPINYSGIMGVPISFMDKVCPEQFEIVGFSSELANPILLPNGKHGSGRFYLNGKRLYDRMTIQYTESWKRDHIDLFQEQDDGKFEINNRRYTGSKYKLIPWIKQTILSECPEHKSLFDVFGGTGVVTAGLLDIIDQATINDFLFSNEVIYKAFLGAGNYDFQKLEKYCIEYNRINRKQLPKNYVSENYGGKYFNEYDARLIGYIRQNLEDNRKELTEREYYILLASLLYSFDRSANTVGHYEAFIKGHDIRASFDFKLISPINTDVAIDIHREDANILAPRVTADIAFLDPPYNSRQYSRFYHVMETITKWDKPILKGVAMKPPEENMSEYCRSSAVKAFADLVGKLNAKYILVTYNNTYNSKSSSSENKISLEEIREILETRGSTKVFDTSYHRFNAGKTDAVDHREYLFLTTVRE